MKIFKLNKILLLTVISISVSADYDSDKFNNYISEQGVNEVLKEAQEIICIVGKLGTEQLASDGSYKAILYADLCEQTSATASTGGQTAPTSANSSSSSSSSSATTGAAATAKDIDTLIVNTGFVTSDEQLTKIWQINDTPYDDETNRMPKHILYVKGEQTAPVSSTSKFGDFTLKYQAATFGNTQADLPEWYECPEETSQQYQYSWCSDGANLGEGLLIASGNEIKFKSQLDGRQQNMVAEYGDNGDISGVYTRETGFQDESLRNPECDGIEGDWWECQSEEYRNSNTTILGIFSFGISSDSNTYCTKMSSLYKVDWENYDEETRGPTLTDYTLTGEPLNRLGKEGWDVSEKCFSILKSDAIKNIYQYGVYNSNGSDFELANQSFPIRASITENEVEKRVHGYASYWGVHVQDEFQDKVTDTTQWVKDDGSDVSDTLTTFNVIPRKLMVEKREKKFLPLNDLDGLGLNFWTNDSWWSDEFEKLGFAKIEPSDGKIQFKSSKAVMTDYNNGSSTEPLTYNLYGQHDGNSSYTADLVGAKLDRDNLRKIIKNDSNDPGKAMDLTMEFQDFPKWGDWKPQEYVVIFLCNGDFSSTAGFPTNFNQLNITSNSSCLRVSGQLIISSEDGNEMILSSKANEGYDASFIDTSSGTVLGFSYENWNQSGYEYDFKITKAGIERPAAMEIKLQSLLSAFGGISQFDDNGGDISSGLEGFLDSSSSFTFMIASWVNIYDHEGNRFNKIKGTFGVDATPPATVYVDDVKVNEPATSTASSFPVSLSKAQASAVTFDYVISSSSTASAADYTNLENGTVTIAAGATSTTISFNVEPDTLVEGTQDEKIILTLTNPANAVLGRANAIAYIFDDDTNRVVYDDYVGSFSAETSTFTITDGLKFNPSYSKTELPEPITFTTAQWLANMKKVQGAGEEWEYTEYRDLNVWSQDTNSSYTIIKESFEDPTASSKEKGVSTVANTIVPISQLPSKLSCIRECLTDALVTAHYQDVKSQADPSADGTYSGTVSVASPTVYADVGPYIKTTFVETTVYNEGTADEFKDERDWTRGQWFDGIIADDVYVYTTTNGSLTDAAGSELSIGIDWQLSRPYDKIQGAKFANIEGNWFRETQWGVNTGELVDDATLALLECDFTVDSDNNKTYTNTHPEYTAANGKSTKTRYCAEKLWTSNDIVTTYSVRLDTHKNYEIFNSDGSNIAFDPPKTLYFTAPETAAFGADAGKKFRLDYQGDYLGGIPGSVIDIDTGNDLGEYVEEWQESYRWVPRFVIPDGSLLTENTSDNTYKVKALSGEEWLGKKDSAIGSMPELLSSKSKSDLLNNNDLDWDIMQAKITWYDCSLTKTVTDTYVDSDGNTQTETREETDWDACYASEDPSIWSVRETFNDCSEVVTFYLNEIQGQIDSNIANDPNYSGPTTADALIASEPENYAWIIDESARCQTIGPIPTTLINSGEAAVVNGDVVYDPTPSSQ